MDILKRYWWIGVVLILLPALFNLCYFIPGFQIFQEPKSWTSFWGEYLGAVLSTLIAFFILHKQLTQNHEENEYNRNLQINSIRYEQKIKAIDNMKESFSVLFDALDQFKILNLRDKLFYYYHPLKDYRIPKDDVEKNIDHMLRELNMARFKYYASLINIDKVDKDESGYLTEIHNIINEHVNLFIDFSMLINNIPTNERRCITPVYIKQIIERSQGLDIEYKSKSINDLIEEVDYQFYENADVIINKRVQSLSDTLNLSKRVPNVFNEFLEYEQKKIDGEFNSI